MARIPDLNSLGPRPAPQSGGQAMPPDLSGAAQTNAELWAQIGSSAVQVGRVYEEQKYKDDQIKAEDSYNKLQQKKLELSAEYRQLKSGDAVKKPIYKDYGAKFEAAQTEIANSLENDQQKEMFQRRADVARLQYNADLTSHIIEQKNIFDKQVYTGGLAVELQNSGTNYNNENVVKAALLRTEKLTDMEADREGWASDVTKAAKAQAISKIHENVIENAIANEDYSYAQQWLKDNKKSITSEDLPRLEGMVKESGIRGQSQDFVDNVFNKGLSETDAKKQARQTIKDPTLRDAVIQRIESRYGEAQQELDRAQKAVGEQARSYFANTGQLPDLLTLQKMDGAERLALEAAYQNKTTGKDVKTDLKTYYGLMETANRSPEQFKAINLYGMYDKIAKPDLDKLISMQQKTDDLDIERTKTQVKDEAAVAAGLDPKDLKESGTTGDTTRAFYDRIDQESIAFQRDNGRKPNAKELKEISDRLAIKIVKDRYILGEGILPKWMTSGPSIPLWPTSEKAVGVSEIKGVPPEYTDELAKAVKEAGQPVTEENIQKLYHYLRSK